MRNTSSFQFRMKACAAGVASAMLLSGSAWGQAVASDTGPEIEAIQITGSRIARDGYDTPTPVSVLSTEDILKEAPGSIAEFVSSMPSVQGSTTASTSSGSLSNGAAGIAALNLRSLGTGRTLVLFDGQRSVTSATTGQVDTNTFPQSLVERVEIVTGGASSAYGSDAIGGVVNFILDRDFTGVKSSVEYGQTTYGDNDNEKFVFTGGMDIAQGQGHVLFSAEYYNMDGVHYTNRDWNTTGYFGIPNPDKTPGAPSFIVGSGIGISAYTPGGLITAGPLKGTYFGVDGVVNQLAYGTVSGQWMVGGDWEYATSGMMATNSLAADDKRDSYFGRVSYELTPDIEVFAQASYAGYEGLSYYINPTQTGISIRSDNAFLPTSVKNSMAAQGLTTFTMGTSNVDMPASGSNNSRETERFVTGVDGSFFAMNKSFDWDAYYQLGITETDEIETPTWNNAKLALATDAVINPATGGIVCRSTLTSPTNGCVPLNRFGVGVASQAALDYVLGNPQREQKFDQQVIAFNVSTNDFSGWAGPISVAAGAEYREEEVKGTVDPIYDSGWKYGNYKVTAGKYDVAEAYMETIIPLMDNLEFNGAARYTDYSTSGGVTTWKTGLTYMPIDDLTFRLTKSRDIRAPNMEELYAAGTARSNSVAINGQSIAFVQNLIGSTAVGPEEADTLGGGVIVQPAFLPGFQTALDYYEIEIDGVISFVNAQDVTDFCIISGLQRYCDNMRYNSSGALAFIDLKYENLDSLKARGLDLESSYTFDMDDLFGWGAGEVKLRALATHYLENVTDNGITAIDEAGDNAGNTPDWVYRLTASYDLDDWSFNMTARGLSDGVVGNQYVECASACPAVASPYFTINDNSVEGEVFFDAYAARSLSLSQGTAEFFISVKNLFDTDPVLVVDPSGQGGENRPGYYQTNRSLYDVMGRNFRLGMRYEF